MKNIWIIFITDLKHLFTNVISAIVVIGLIIVPSLYAWFSIAAFWNPYENTHNVEVAIVNLDQGYQSDLIPIKINAGNSVIATLHENNSFNWIFTNNEDAYEGVESGKYYASIIIPETFSSDLMSLFSDNINQSEIIYYINEKENAIAPHLTQAGVDTIQTEINETFNETVDNMALNMVKNLLNYLDSDNITSYAAILSKNLDSVLNQIDDLYTQTQSFSNLLGASSDLFISSSELLNTISNNTLSISEILNSTKVNLSEANNAIDSSSTLISDTLAQTNSNFNLISTYANQAFDNLSQDPIAATSLLGSIVDTVQNLIITYQTISEQLSTSNTDTTLENTLNQNIKNLENTLDQLTSFSSQMDNITRNINSSQSDINQILAEAQNSLIYITSEYKDSLSSSSNKFINNIDNLESLSETISNNLTNFTNQLSLSSGNFAVSLDNIQNSLNDVANTLQTTSNNLAHAKTDLENAISLNDIQTIQSLITTNSDDIAKFLASPTKIERHVIYPIENTGSAMSAFYTSLSIWINAIFLVLFMKVFVSKKQIKQLSSPTENQLYIGRYGIFCLLALIQSTVVACGNVFFLDIQCQHFILYLIACWVTAIVFSNIVYTLMISFGNVGKALAIILLVLQIAGSGGIFPVEMSGPFFISLYPWLPFAHSMPAMQSCIAGIYDNQYLLDLILLSLFLIPSLILGFVIRKPIIKFNKFFLEKVEETKLI